MLSKVLVRIFRYLISRIKHFLSLGFESGSNAEGPGSNSSFTYIVVIYTIYYLHNKYWDFYYTYNKCNSSIRNGFEAAARTTFTFKSSFEKDTYANIFLRKKNHPKS